MIDASEPLLPNMDVKQEYEELDKLLKECQGFLSRWRADKPYKNETNPDAIVAVYELTARVIARRSYILGLLHQEQLPF